MASQRRLAPSLAVAVPRRLPTSQLILGLSAWKVRARVLAWFRGGSKAKQWLFTRSFPVDVQRLDGPRVGAAMGGSTGLNAKGTVAVVSRASRMSSKPPTSLLGAVANEQCSRESWSASRQCGSSSRDWRWWECVRREQSSPASERAP